MKKIFEMLSFDAESIATPSYIYSVGCVKERYEALRSKLGTDVILSVKANSNPDLLTRVGPHILDGVEVASLGELEIAVSIFPLIYVNNPSADYEFLRAAVAANARVIVDNLEQFDILQDIGLEDVEGILLRANLTAVLNDGEEQPKDQFGMDWETIECAVGICKKESIRLLGIHMFNGSNLFVSGAFAIAAAAKEFVQKVEDVYEDRISFLNLGGGFPEGWETSEFEFPAYRKLLSDLPDHITVAHESGRGIMGNAGYFLVRVRLTKSIGKKFYAVCDGGIAQNFLLAKTESALSKLKMPSLWQATPTNKRSACEYVGSSCSRDDVIGEQSEEHLLPVPGDICVFDRCGAYNASYTVAPFLRLPEPTIYIVD